MPEQLLLFTFQSIYGDYKTRKGGLQYFVDFRRIHSDDRKNQKLLGLLTVHRRQLD